MDSHGFLFNLIVYLSAAVIAVPVFAKLGLGSVLGYLVAGICIGPWGLRFIQNVQDILHFSEIGVVLLLFLIGLELEPKKLWGMRQPILVAGGLQVGCSAAAIAGIAMLLGIDWGAALVLGLGLSLSSTAIALQMMNERHLMPTPLGKTGFSILLFQDISVIPILGIIPLLAIRAVVDSGDVEHNVPAMTVIAVMVGIFVIGKYALRHIFRFVASTHVPEIFTALSLLLVGGVAAIMNSIGVSMALGAFVAGVILADSEYRHALESDIQPFKGLLLGLFFISVGMSIDFGLLIEQPLLILALTLCLVSVKAVVLYVISWIMKVPASQRGLFSCLLSQSGEFGFVLFGFAVTANAISPVISDQAILVIAMSMVMTPLLVIINDRYIEPRYIKSVDQPMDEIDEENDVILVGFGRIGQVIGRMLHLSKINPTVIDNDPDHIERVRRFGYKTYYGDVLRHDVLHSVGADKAKLIILTGDGVETINQAVAMIQSEFPNLKIITRAYDRGHAMQLIDNGVKVLTRETFYSAVEMGKKTLRELGFDEDSVNRLGETYIKHDVATLHQQVENRLDEKAMITIANSAREQLEETLRADQEERSADDKDPESSNSAG